MHVHRAQTPSPRRLVAGLAVAAVTTAGLACMGTASAADPAGFPRTLDFKVTDQVATAADVFSVGYIGTGVGQETEFAHVDGYVEAVGSHQQIHLGDGSSPHAVTASADGATLYVIGTLTDEDDPELPRRDVRWTIDSADLEVSEPTLLEGLNPQDITAGPGGVHLAYTDGENVGGVTMAGERVALGQGVQPSQVAVLSSAGGLDDVVVGATDFSEEGAGLPTLRTVDSEGVSDRVVLGPDDTENRGFIVDLDVDEAHGLTYVVTARDVDGPQEYGLNVIGAGTDRFIPLADFVTSVAVSPDGDTVYLANYGVSAYDADALESYDEENPAPSSYLGGDGFVTDLAPAPSGRLYVAQSAETDEANPDNSRSVSRIVALEAPGAPTGVQVVASDWDTQTMLATWAAPTDFGGVPEDSLYYVTTLTDHAGGEPFVQTNFMTEQELSGLEEGHTYTLSVATTNGAFSSEPVTTTFTVQPAVAHPSAITVRGRLAVGSTLSVANTGSWATGTALTYVWGTEDSEDVARGATLTLTKAHLGHNIWVRVTGTKAGSAPATVYSDLSGRVALGTLTARVPSIAGVAKVGKKLTAKAGAWTAGTRLTYRWLANGKAIKGASASTLKLKRAQAGKKITVAVTGTKAGYRTAVKTSKATARVKR